jgi:hypothetical protein
MEAVGVGENVLSEWHWVGGADRQGRIERRKAPGLNTRDRAPSA